jgi:hypothetical protein
MSKKVTILIDGDPPVYKVGFSLEKRTYYLQWRDVCASGEAKDDVEHIAFFYNAAARDRFIELRHLHKDEYASEMVPVPEMNDAIVYGRVKNTLRDIETQIGAYLYEEGKEVGDVRIFLSGKTNYRNNIATIVPYKVSRLNAAKPYHYQNIRDYLIQYCGAEVTDGYEADDAVAFTQCQAEPGTTIICTIDKDLQGVPGYNYNMNKKMAHHITEGEAMRFFYRQVLTGDGTDDIQGCFKIGPKTAEQVIVPGMTEAQMYKECVAQYRQNIEEYPEHHGPFKEAYEGASGDAQRTFVVRECLTENARLLWMQRVPGELWNPPHTPNGSVDHWLESHGGRDPDEDWV